jgi:crotonobetainyl-CoA:carnitine CoA-transferase CaiB-like acyl-CoA transferase
MTILQRQGVPAAAMAGASELPDLPHFQSRPMFQTFIQPQMLDPMTVDNAPVRSDRLIRPPLATAPMVGEHSVEIARDLLRLGPDEIAALFAAGTLQTCSLGDSP